MTISIIACRYGNFQVDVFVEEGRPWFRACHVARIAKFDTESAALRRVLPESKREVVVPTDRGGTRWWFLDERGALAVIKCKAGRIAGDAAAWVERCWPVAAPLADQGRFPLGTEVAQSSPAADQWPEVAAVVPPVERVPVAERHPESLPLAVAKPPGTGIERFMFEGAPVRVIMRDGEPWFVAKDVADRLGYVWNGEVKIAHVPEQWKGVTAVVTPGGNQQMLCLSEQGLYFFLSRSDKPKALPFQMKVAGEIMPSIRKTGSYGTAPAPAIDLNDPAFLRGTLLTYTEKVIALQAANDTLEAKVEVMVPKVALMERIEESEGSITLTEAAKNLQVKPRRFNAWLIAMGWVYRHSATSPLIGHQRKIDALYLTHKSTAFVDRHGVQKYDQQVRVTPRGLVRLAGMLEWEAA